MATASPVVADPNNPAYAYQLLADNSIKIVRSVNPAGVGKIVQPGQRGYPEMRAVIDARQRGIAVNPQVAIAALQAAASITNAAIAPAGTRKRRKFDPSGAAAPVVAPAESGFPGWVWVVGGLLGVVVIGGVVYTLVPKK